jgi:hypothetical protein
MSKLLPALMTVAAMLSSSPTYAATYYFEFTNTLGTGGGEIAGTVTGTLDGSVSGSTFTATEVFIDSYPSGIELGTSQLSGTPTAQNSFPLDGSGNIISSDAEFYSGNVTGGAGGNDLCIDVCTSPYNTELRNVSDGFFVATNEAVTFSNTPFTTPIPAALPLFATGLAALGLVGWRSKRKNAAALAAA